eukprot:CAMPEP_0119040718 /NCGR_PEP_ID=MMETSP1177-20130426/10726_1 /TAXON_ID=2985 /ORGANISM="Ochromonas sp, Strain CCMP1899" /LENGTH=43 /DNA_ID= /DNA_START= /DNA_END= /DNA_ORIENTATION=
MTPDDENSNSSSESLHLAVLEEDSNDIFESIFNEEILNASINE